LNTNNSGPTCGNAIINTEEECDGTNLNNYACINISGFSGGNLSCNSNCTFNTDNCYTNNISECGNGIINSGEECDNQTWGNVTSCQYFGYDAGNLSCVGCHFDLTNCYNETEENLTTECGNGIIDLGEQCDGTKFNGLTCQDFKLNSGSLICIDCVIDTSFCVVNYCGDGIISPGELCDDGKEVIELGDFTCQELGFQSGILGCNDCKFDTSHCVI